MSHLFDLMPELRAQELEALYRHGVDVRSFGFTEEHAIRYYGDYVDFVSHYAPRGTLLDVGCGVGWSTAVFADKGFDAHGIDLNPSGFEPPPRASLCLQEGSGTDIPFPNAMFDVASAYQVLEHVPDPQKMLSEMLRVVKPGGVVCIVGPNLVAWSPAVRALTIYVWRNRPFTRIFCRTTGMPRHPNGNTLPEAALSLIMTAVRLVQKSLSSEARFSMREPDLCPPFHADNDAVYRCNPLDLIKYFQTCGCTIVSDCALGRQRWTRSIAGGTWIAVRKPMRPR